MSAFDTIINFLIGTPPEGLEAINYTFRCLIGIMFFDILMDTFRMLRHLGGIGRR